MAMRTTENRQLWRFLIGFFFQTIPGAMLIPMITLGLAARGVEATLIGALATVASVAYIIALPSASTLIQRLGGQTTFRIALVVSALATAGLTMSDWPSLWVALYAALGFAAGLRYTIAESWVPALAPPEARGRAVALFQTSVGAASFVGAGALLVVGISGAGPRLLIWATCLIGLALLWAQRAPESTVIVQGPRLAASWGGLGGTLAQVGPLVLGAALLGGLFESGLSVVLPLHGLAIGLSPTLVAGLATALGLGSLAQYPFGALADRYPWQHVVLGSTALIGLSALLLPLAQAWPWLLFGLGIVWGSVGGGLYTLATIRNGERLRGAQLVSASVVTQFAYMLSDALGPAVGGLALDLSPQYGLPVLVGGAGLLGLAAMLGVARHSAVRRLPRRADVSPDAA
jgi:MFS family permease